MMASLMQDYKPPNEAVVFYEPESSKDSFLHLSLSKHSESFSGGSLSSFFWMEDPLPHLHQPCILPSQGGHLVPSASFSSSVLVPDICRPGG